MNTIPEIVTRIEEQAIKKFGSINKMLLDNGINKSVLDNMKRSKPSIPNIITFCKLAECLNVSVDYLLNGEDANYNKLINAKELINDKLTADERSLVNTYRDIDDEGKTLMLDTAKEIWADHRQPKGKSYNSEIGKLIG